VRIAQVAPLYESVPPRLYGGTERVVSYLTEALVEDGHDVTLFASGDSRTRANLQPIVEQSLRLSRCVDPIAHHMRMISQVADAASAFDVIHFHIDYLHFPLSRALKLRHLTTLHGRLDLPDLPPLYAEFSDMPVVSISKSQRAPLPIVNWAGNVYHGLPAASFSPVQRAGTYLAFIGRISPEKRLDRAIELAIATGIPLRIAAKVDRVDEAYFEEKIRPMLAHPLVEYIGEIGEHEKQAFLGNALALAFLIDWPEPFGLVMIEALACGTPVIAWRRGSTPEILEHGVTGFIVQSMDEAVQAVRQIGEIDRRACRASFAARFTSPRMARDYIDVYRQLASPTAEARIAIA
jgi:glycosyltransferase involved in cell wall biosynthesis